MNSFKLLSIFFSFSFLISCSNNKDCPPVPLGDNEIAGYVDGKINTLFTTEKDKDDVLASLDASPHLGETYKMPVFEVENNQVYLLFNIMEVDQPAAYMNLEYGDYCYASIFNQLEMELYDLIELNEDNLADQFIIACGDAIGEIADKEKEKNAKAKKGEEKDAIKKLKENEKAKKETKKDISKTAKEKGNEAKEKLNNGDKDGAKEKAKELADECKEKVKLKFNFGWEFCEDWEFKLDLGYWWNPVPAEIPPELINSFTKDFIRYRVYKDADCGPGPPTIDFGCWKLGQLDTIPPVRSIWETTEHLPRKVCVRGTGFCVEQEVVIANVKQYSDSLCSRQIHVYPIMGFSCFD